MQVEGYKIVELEATEAEARLSQLADVLVDAVDSGASVSFMPPFSHSEATAFWQRVITAVTANQTVLLAALSNDRIMGTVQLSMSTPPNQSHRADVAKLLVHRQARRLGIGRSLMQTLETVARRHNRTLLTLDTMTGSGAERLYLSLGYVPIGIIPDYALFPDGTIGDTTFFYKQL